jgi:hypothetical protein
MDVLEGASRPWATDTTTLDDILALLDPPAWHADAACREHPDLTWFPDRGQDTSAAVAVCRGCLVADQCRAWAMSQGAGLHGIWAGTSDRERQRLRRA